MMLVENQRDGTVQRFVGQLRDMPQANGRVRARAREALLDYIGCVYAGGQALGERRAALESLSGSEKGRGLAVGSRGDAPMKEAVFLNGLFAHALDFDDGVNRGIIHLGSPIFSVLLPLAKVSGATGEELIEAAIAGYEAAWTLADTVQPAHKLRGFHATGTCGSVGAAYAGAQLLRLDEDATVRAVSVALVSSTGMLKVLDDRSELKPYNVAKAALMALSSLEMAMAGLVVPDDALGGERGFLEIFGGRRDLPLTPPMLDGLFAIERAYIKPYAACRYCHPAIEAAARIGTSLGHNTERIVSVSVRTYDLAVRGHDHDGLDSPASAKMSIPYGVAAALVHGRAGLAEYEADVQAEEPVARLSRMVRVTSDDDFSATFPELTTAVVDVSLADGPVLSERVDHPLGEPENPLGWAGVGAKFRELVAWAGMPEGWAEEMVGCVSDVEERLPRLLELLDGRTA